MLEDGAVEAAAVEKEEETVEAEEAAERSATRERRARWRLPVVVASLHRGGARERERYRDARNGVGGGYHPGESEQGIPPSRFLPASPPRNHPH